MKLYIVMLIAVFLYLISCVLRNTVFYSEKLEQNVQQEFQSYTAKRFIAQSFKNTCKQKGFQNFEQWQQVCKALFNLESISYETYSVEKNIIYAAWKGSENFKKCSGEVYYKLTQGGMQ